MGTASDTSALGEEFLAHYGVKGMKWGQHRAALGARIAKAKHPQTEPDSHDVVQVKAAKAKIRNNKTTNVLSNKELQDVVTRMNLEQQYSRLVAPSANSRSAKLQKAGIEFATNTAIGRVEAPITAMAQAKYGDMGAAAVSAAFSQMKPQQSKKKNGNGNG